MDRKRFGKAPCSIARTLDVIGDWWTPLILRECLYGVRRFDELQRWLGIGRNILSRRLSLLVAQGVIERTSYREKPLRYEYGLTEKGYDAAKLLLAMMPFGEAWFFRAGQEPIRVYSRKTGRRVRPVVVDGDTGEPIEPRDLYAGPGPSFPKGAQLRRERFQEFHLRQREANEAPPRRRRNAKAMP